MTTVRLDAPADLGRRAQVTLFPLALGLFAVFVALRLLLFIVFPIFTTNDSPEYLVASDGIFRSLDFNNSGLSNWRSPLYPTLLAVTRPLTQLRSDPIVVFQTILGLAAVLLAASLGYLLNSRAVGVVLAVFFGINPIFLLYEHAVMTEAFFSLAVLGVAVMVLVCLRGPLSFYKGAGLGIVAAACVLIRTNAIAYCLSMIMVVAVVYALWPRLVGRSSDLAGSRRAAFRFLAGAGLFLGLIVGLWVWRNYTAFGIASVSASTNQLVVFYLTEEGLLDLSLPVTHEFNRTYNPADPGTAFDFTWQMRKVAPSTMEPLANRMIIEQVTHHPAPYALAVLNSAINFGGYPVSYVPGPATDLSWWFGHDVANIDALNVRNKALADSLPPIGYAYDARPVETIFTTAWQWAGLTYLQLLRPLLSVAFVTSCILFICLKRLRKAGLTTAFVIATLLGYFPTLGLHALTLSAYDRYATPFDWIEVMVVTVVLCNILTVMKFGALRKPPQQAIETRAPIRL